jgi:hypothetical protein
MQVVHNYQHPEPLFKPQPMVRRVPQAVHPYSIALDIFNYDSENSYPKDKSKFMEPEEKALEATTSLSEVKQVVTSEIEDNALDKN